MTECYWSEDYVSPYNDKEFIVIDFNKIPIVYKKDLWHWVTKNKPELAIYLDTDEGRNQIKSGLTINIPRENAAYWAKQIDLYF